MHLVIGLLQLAGSHPADMQLSLEEEEEVMPLAVQLLQLAILQVRVEADGLPIQVQHQLALPATEHIPPDDLLALTLHCFLQRDESGNFDL